jgi:hypothetical protein
MDWKHLLAYITGSVDEGLLLHDEYLVTENRILRQQITDRMSLSDGEHYTEAAAQKDERPHPPTISNRPAIRQPADPPPHRICPLLCARTPAKAQHLTYFPASIILRTPVVGCKQHFCRNYR